MAEEIKKSITDIVRESILEPKSAEVDGQKVENRSIAELKPAELIAGSSQARAPLSSVRIARARGNSAV